MRFNGKGLVLYPFRFYFLFKPDTQLRILRKIQMGLEIWRNMGNRYLLFRVSHELDKRTGKLAKRFPTQPPILFYPDLSEGKTALGKFPWPSRETFRLERRPTEILKEKAEEILNGNLLLFNAIPYSFRKEEDWVIHPETGFRYDNRKHWTQIPDMSAEAGDIKYVWEKSRFSYLHSVLRYDHHFRLDHAEWVFSEIESWIRNNPINCGPNYRCSQEISLRVLNWLGAISFYQDSPALTTDRWNHIFHHMYWQIHHVWENIQFSRIAVRNNHAITETLVLYIFGSLFPSVNLAKEWKKMGKSWFEEEIEYQIYPDGSYLQFSMNYHRVVVQLLTLALRFSENEKEDFKPVVYQRAHQTLRFLRFFQDPVSGQLPNYGANDGALFFQFTDDAYRVYESQLNALHAALTGENIRFSASTEESYWFGHSGSPKIFEIPALPEKLQVFGNGGFGGIKEEDTLTFFRSGKHKDRPGQADNHHLDLWYQGINILRDAGSYKYNAPENDIRFFFGSRSHNTVMVDNQDQMLKGPRFVWMYWSQSVGFFGKEEENGWQLGGEIEAFRQIRKGIRHKRTIFKERGKPIWRIEDQMQGLKGEEMKILWHPAPQFADLFTLEIWDEEGKKLDPVVQQGWYSGLYGIKEAFPYWEFSTRTKKAVTLIRLKK